MSLSSIVESLQKRPLTPEESASLNEFQQEFDIDDDDPLLVVLAMMARSQLIVETAPKVLQQKVNETIELHRTVLREQALLIAKELIQELSQQIQRANAGWKKQWLSFFLVFVGGAFFAFVLMTALKSILR